MKKTTLLVFLHMIISCLLISCNSDRSYPISKIIFDQPAQEMNFQDAELVFDINEKKISTLFEKELNIYQIVEKKVDAEKLLKIFHFVEYEKEKDTTVDKVKYKDKKNNNELQIFGNGNFVFISGNRFKAETTAITLSDEDVKAQAEKFLRDNNLLPEEFYFGGSGYSSSGNSLSEDKVIFEKTVGFHRKIDGYKVYGHSDISVTYDANGLAAVYSIYNDYLTEKAISCKTYQAAKQDIFKDSSWINFDSTAISDEKTVKIDDCQIIYYDNASSSDTTHIQPCYSFNGEIFDSKGQHTKFSSVVPAIPDEFLTE